MLYDHIEYSYSDYPVLISWISLFFLIDIREAKGASEARRRGVNWTNEVSEREGAECHSRSLLAARRAKRDL